MTANPPVLDDEPFPPVTERDQLRGTITPLRFYVGHPSVGSESIQMRVGRYHGVLRRQDVLLWPLVHKMSDPPTGLSPRRRATFAYGTHGECRLLVAHAAITKFHRGKQHQWEGPNELAESTRSAGACKIATT